MIYSNYKLATRKAYEYIKLWHCDTYVNEHHYPSGFEYSIDDHPGHVCVFHAKLRMDHKFPPTRHGRRLAFEYAKKFEKQLNRCIFVQEVIEERNGYRFKEGFILTDVEPSDINE